jgi:ParB family transcriptional regulator, chromosome partitioning protein
MTSTPERIQVLGVEFLLRAEWNARKTFAPAALDELAESIKVHGVQVPLLVRNLESPEGWNGGPRYEIVAGHRRHAAAIVAGLRDVPCIVRDLTDAEAREIGLVDNLQREDVPALEEADAYEELRLRLGGAAAIAARVGKDVAYVARRLQLVTLGALPRRALAGGLITIDHALLIARLGEEQDLVLKWTLRTSAGIKETAEAVLEECLKERDRDAGNRHFGYWQPQSVLNLKQHIEQNTGRLLSRAPWDLETPMLGAVPQPCNGCAMNTGRNTSLFSDLAIEAATCADAGCFEHKRAAFVQIALDEWPGLVRLSHKSSEAEPRMKDGAINENAVLRSGQWIEAKKKSCDHMRQGVAVDWSDDDRYAFSGARKKLRKPGEIIDVCIAPKCKAHPKSYEKRAHRSNGGYDPKAEAEKRARTAAAAKIENALRIQVASATISKLVELPAEALRGIVLESFQSCDDKACAALFGPGIDKTLKTAKVDSEEFARAAAIVSLGDAISVYEYADATCDRDEFLAGMKRLGAKDVAKAWQKPAPAAAKTTSKKKTILSADAKKRIAEAQRKRWAVAKKKAGRK